MTNTNCVDLLSDQVQRLCSHFNENPPGRKNVVDSGDMQKPLSTRYRGHFVLDRSNEAEPNSIVEASVRCHEIQKPKPNMGVEVEKGLRYRIRLAYDFDPTLDQSCEESDVTLQLLNADAPQKPSAILTHLKPVLRKLVCKLVESHRRSGLSDPDLRRPKRSRSHSVGKPAVSSAFRYRATYTKGVALNQKGVQTFELIDQRACPTRVLSDLNPSPSVLQVPQFVTHAHTDGQADLFLVDIRPTSRDQEQEIAIVSPPCSSGLYSTVPRPAINSAVSLSHMNCVHQISVQNSGDWLWSTLELHSPHTGLRLSTIHVSGDQPLCRAITVSLPVPFRRSSFCTTTSAYSGSSIEETRPQHESTLVSKSSTRVHTSDSWTDSPKAVRRTLNWTKFLDQYRHPRVHRAKRKRIPAPRALSAMQYVSIPLRSIMLWGSGKRLYPKPARANLCLNPNQFGTRNHWTKALMIQSSQAYPIIQAGYGLNLLVEDERNTEREWEVVRVTPAVREITLVQTPIHFSECDSQIVESLDTNTNASYMYPHEVGFPSQFCFTAGSKESQWQGLSPRKTACRHPKTTGQSSHLVFAVHDQRKHFRRLHHRNVRQLRNKCVQQLETVRLLLELGPGWYTLCRYPSPPSEDVAKSTDSTASDVNPKNLQSRNNSTVSFEETHSSLIDRIQIIKPNQHRRTDPQCTCARYGLLSVASLDPFSRSGSAKASVGDRPPTEHSLRLRTIKVDLPDMSIQQENPEGESYTSHRPGEYFKQVPNLRCKVQLESSLEDQKSMSRKQYRRANSVNAKLDASKIRQYSSVTAEQHARTGSTCRRRLEPHVKSTVKMYETDKFDLRLAKRLAKKVKPPMTVVDYNSLSSKGEDLLCIPVAHGTLQPRSPYYSALFELNDRLYIVRATSSGAFTFRVPTLGKQRSRFRHPIVRKIRTSRPLDIKLCAGDSWPSPCRMAKGMPSSREASTVGQQVKESEFSTVSSIASDLIETEKLLQKPTVYPEDPGCFRHSTVQKIDLAVGGDVVTEFKGMQSPEVTGNQIEGVVPQKRSVSALGKQPSFCTETVQDSIPEAVVITVSKVDSTSLTNQGTVAPANSLEEGSKTLFFAHSTEETSCLKQNFVSTGMDAFKSRAMAFAHSDPITDVKLAGTLQPHSPREPVQLSRNLRRVSRTKSYRLTDSIKLLKSPNCTKHVARINVHSMNPQNAERNLSKGRRRRHPSNDPLVEKYHRFLSSGLSRVDGRLAALHHKFTNSTSSSSESNNSNSVIMEFIKWNTRVGTISLPVSDTDKDINTLTSTTVELTQPFAPVPRKALSTCGLLRDFEEADFFKPDLHSSSSHHETAGRQTDHSVVMDEPSCSIRFCDSQASTLSSMYLTIRSENLKLHSAPGDLDCWTVQSPNLNPIPQSDESSTGGLTQKEAGDLRRTNGDVVPTLSKDEYISLATSLPQNKTSQTSAVRVTITEPEHMECSVPLNPVPDHSLVEHVDWMLIELPSITQNLSRALLLQHISSKRTDANGKLLIGYSKFYTPAVVTHKGLLKSPGWFHSALTQKASYVLTRLAYSESLSDLDTKRSTSMNAATLPQPSVTRSLTTYCTCCCRMDSGTNDTRYLLTKWDSIVCLPPTCPIRSTFFIAIRPIKYLAQRLYLMDEIESTMPFDDESFEETRPVWTEYSDSATMLWARHYSHPRLRVGILVQNEMRRLTLKNYCPERYLPEKSWVRRKLADVTVVRKCERVPDIPKNKVESSRRAFSAYLDSLFGPKQRNNINVVYRQLSPQNSSGPRFHSSGRVIANYSSDSDTSLFHLRSLMARTKRAQQSMTTGITLSSDRGNQGLRTLGRVKRNSRPTTKFQLIPHERIRRCPCKQSLGHQERPRATNSNQVKATIKNRTSTSKGVDQSRMTRKEIYYSSQKSGVISQNNPGLK